MWTMLGPKKTKRVVALQGLKVTGGGKKKTHILVTETWGSLFLGAFLKGIVGTLGRGRNCLELMRNISKIERWTFLKER